jgi:hypothetical protein
MQRYGLTQEWNQGPNNPTIVLQSYEIKLMNIFKIHSENGEKRKGCLDKILKSF